MVLDVDAILLQSCMTRDLERQQNIQGGRSTGRWPVMGEGHGHKAINNFIEETEACH